MLHDVVPALYDEQKGTLSKPQPATSLVSDAHLFKTFPKLSEEWARDTKTSVTYYFNFFWLNIRFLIVFL